MSRGYIFRVTLTPSYEGSAVVSSFSDEELQPEVGWSRAQGDRASQKWTQDFKASLFKEGASLGPGGWWLFLPRA